MRVHWDGSAAITALILATCTAYLLQHWDTDESWRFNLLIIILPRLIEPPVEKYLDQQLEKQMVKIQRMRNQMEMLVQNEQSLRFAMGNALVDASYGPNATRVATLQMKGLSSSHQSIEVVCTCPHGVTEDDVLPLIFFFHSGGLIVGSVNAELHKARYLSQQSKAVVCSPEYRLAPEHPYPAGLDDCVETSLAILVDDGRRNEITKALSIGGVDFSKVGTFGLSAGGYLSAHVARELTAAGHKLALQVSLVPMVQPHGGGTRSMFRHWYFPMWNGPLNLWAWSLYLSEDLDGTLAHHHRVNLLVDPPEEDTVRRLPLAYIQINTKDVLRDEGERYAHRLKEQGKLLRLDEYNTNHVGGALPGLANGGPGANAFEDAVNVVVEHFR